MNKLVAVVLLGLLSAAHAEVERDIYGLRTHGKFSAHTDDYITLNGLQYKRILDEYDEKLQEFEDSYLERLETVTINREFLVKSVVKAVDRWDPMLVLSDFTKQCIIKYRYDIPTVELTRTAVNKCHEDYSKQLSTLLTAAVSTRNALSGYIANYKREVEKCGSRHDETAASYTLCVSTVTGKTNKLVISNEKSFQVQLEAAECTAKANVKSAIDCSYTVQVRTHTIIAESDVLIERCMWHKDECKPCADYTCTESYDLELNIQNQTIYNPFYGRTDNPRCIMLKPNSIYVHK